MADRECRGQWWLEVTFALLGLVLLNKLGLPNEVQRRAASSHISTS
jgi:hypothetical protein